MSQLYYDIARAQWSAWAARLKAWWESPERDWAVHDFILEMIWKWREIATPHGSASRYVVT
jgi:hypothetical protein